MLDPDVSDTVGSKERNVSSTGNSVPRGAGLLRWLPVPVVILAVTSVLAADRHVYLDTNGDGKLNDCPNPAHNVKGTSNTDELQYCKGGTASGKLIGTASGTTSSTTCTSGGGTVTAVTNGVSADVDRDGTNEFVYGHPQACVWNMAQSDSCEIHAGTYRRAGGQCDENCAYPGVAQTLNACDRGDCWMASVVAFGDGPNLRGSGYGTASSPGYLRGARMLGSFDSWDPNGDKNPADGAYPAILTGDRNNDGVFDATTCGGGVCTGDFFYGAIVGCGRGSYGASYCDTSPASGYTFVRLDTNADGAFDTNTNVSGVKNVNNLVIQDLVFKGYNGGNAATAGGARNKEGLISLEGDGTPSGLVVDHVHIYGNGYTLTPSSEKSWAAISDGYSEGCPKWTEIKNSFIVQTNEKTIDNDNSPATGSGCPFNIHDNRFLIDVTDAAARTSGYVVWGYLKAIDRAGSNGTERPKMHRIWNNEFIIKNARLGHFLDLQGFGNGQGFGEGELWVYGNIFRNDPGAPSKMKYFWWSSCGTGTDSWRAYVFNNTFDMDFPDSKGIYSVCSTAGEIIAERNDAFMLAGGLYQTQAATMNRVANLPATAAQAPVSGSQRSTWFDPGAASPGVHEGIANYHARVGGPLDGTGTCDPDGDGVAGVDWNWDGVNDTTWVDIAGNTVSCPSLTSTTHIGAIAAGPGGPIDTTPPAAPAALERTDTKP